MKLSDGSDSYIDMYIANLLDFTSIFFPLNQYIIDFTLKGILHEQWYQSYNNNIINKSKEAIPIVPTLHTALKASSVF